MQFEILQNFRIICDNSTVITCQLVLSSCSEHFCSCLGCCLVQAHVKFVEDFVSCFCNKTSASIILLFVVQGRLTLAQGCFPWSISLFLIKHAGKCDVANVLSYCIHIVRLVLGFFCGFGLSTAYVLRLLSIVSHSKSTVFSLNQLNIFVSQNANVFT